ncbi:MULTISPECIES: S24 family peptidase [Methylosinus]|uniref:Helix-turn-helix transcriptional regulator n=1 Tax=Methylosinus trichosporium (strain ATCC 35070 / NCIMB 11131 / UNIQEM 75 / OB3b) TaxID=595536 RepID=A0A2D2CW79_METT3|nr:MULTISPECIES: helix-turn-helix transcriptional regulator [Methylosinus]ATQ67031.1 helix-turn-helix transcriptional regulator [Methylosinus trichosporium OB3b]OBS50834.1 DNA-binding protein [Methylosinus sp. 3S-1]
MAEILTHAQIWAALDALGERYGLTPSGLARKAGLDPTTFNRSKRQTADGHLRWPSTESIAKVLQATGAGLDEFMTLVSSKGARPSRSARPLIGLAQAGVGGFFDDAGFAIGAGWEEIDVLADTDEHSYALEISGDSMAPLYRDGDIVIVSPSAPVRRGDRVVVKTIAGEILAKELKRQTAKTVELKSLNPAFPDRVLPKEEVSWMARILWASQ